MTRLRVLIAEDSLTVRRRLVDALAGDAGFEVVGEADNGRHAFELCRALRPDVVTMDMVLPEVDGLAATEQIMAYCPTPILVVSASVNRGELFATYDALAAGAVDVLDKPRADEPDAEWDARFRAAVRMVARVRVITHLRHRLQALARSAAPTAPPIAAAAAHAGRRPAELVAIGASTGGPSAVMDVLRALPASFPAPIAVVVHIGASFSSALAEWLSTQARRTVAHARDGEPIAGAAGRVVLAPPDRHLVVRAGRFALVDAPAVHSCRPSVDVLFESIARELGGAGVGCLLTGMGRDGARGLLAMRQRGALTIAQDEATSVVYGMPREAAELGAAERILPLADIAPALAAVIGRRSP